MAVFVKATVIEKPGNGEEIRRFEAWINAERIEMLAPGEHPQESFVMIGGEARRLDGSPEELLRKWFPQQPAPVVNPLLLGGIGQIPGLRKM
jgi:hypothetical protein